MPAWAFRSRFNSFNHFTKRFKINIRRDASSLLRQSRESRIERKEPTTRHAGICVDNRLDQW
jgi:hypothetical protein